MVTAAGREYETVNDIVAHKSGLAGYSVEGAARWTMPKGIRIDS